MATISFRELVSLVKSSPNYKAKLEQDVPAEQILYVKFSSDAPEGVASDVLELVGGGDFVVDRNADGRVVGIEIFGRAICD